MQGFIEDTTRSGKAKRRLSASVGSPREFSIKMMFTYTEYQLFKAWYNDVILKGLYAFKFPCIEGEGDSEGYSVYRFSNGGTPSYSNNSGAIVEVSMKWEEVA